MIEKSDSKWIFLATVSIFGQPPSPSQKLTHSKRGILKRERYTIQLHKKFAIAIL
ncbi:MAG: hypothetical protein V3V31_04540 [Methylococcales bacterium]